MVYAFFDGDKIGDTLEILLLDGKTNEANDFSRKLRDAIEKIHKKLNSLSGVEIIVWGGDDVLVHYQDCDHPKLIEEVRTLFVEITGSTMSCGAGETIQKSIQNLHLAKLNGRNRVVS